MDHQSNVNQDLITVIALGALAGVRSLLPQAVVSRALRDRAVRLPEPFAILGSEPVARALSGAALMELAGDKVPGMTARIRPLPLIGRVVSGGAAGFVTGAQRRRNAPLFAALGAAAAALATFGSYHLRELAIRRLGLSSTVSGVIEDGLALVAARSVMRRLER